MSIESKISMLTKQNDSIYTSLVARNIIFNRVDVSIIESLDNKLDALVDENNKLKEVVKANKPPPVIKEVKPVLPPQPKKESIVKVKEEDDDLEETYEDAKTKYNVITNMEDIKRAFCNKEYETFEALIQPHHFKYYNVQYKYASDNNGAPEFVAKNLVGGFIRSLEDSRKYLFVGFRCVLTDLINKTYSYPSMWIVNSTDPIDAIISTMYNDFEFVEVVPEQMTSFLSNFRKTNFDVETNVIDERYLH
jgi:hypothetical protein